MSEMFEGIEAVVDDLLIWGECKAALQLPDADSRQSNTVKSIAEQAQVPNKKTKSATLVTFKLKDGLKPNPNKEKPYKHTFTEGQQQFLGMLTY